MNALDELEEIKELVNGDKKFKYKSIINFNCESIEKELKALEIIISDKCNFIPLSKFKNWTYDLYLRWFDLNHYPVKYLLTEEEFNTLKEVLE